MIEDAGAGIDEEIGDALPAMRIARVRCADHSDTPEPSEDERAAQQQQQQRQQQEQRGAPGRGQEAASSARLPQTIRAAADPDDLVSMINRGSRIELEPRERARRLGAVAGHSEEAIRHTVTELFSPPRVNAQIKSTVSGLIAGSSFDLIVDQDTGEAWNFLST